MSATQKQREQWESELKKDYPNINPWILKILLDTYCAENGKNTLDMIIKNETKKERKASFKGEVKPIKREPLDIMGQASVSKWNEEWEKKIEESHKAVNAKAELKFSDETENKQNKITPYIVEQNNDFISF